ncbi:vitamin K epoxide reductase family protein [Rhodococcus sp. 105337]|uniref:vitamin K epoxide reductase family protein n=1 Tax=Rhodococcus sp. 105337 TaxID=2725310 RepID=UPI00146DC9B9|nr:vitamin K epoxide reductase family protein [Rhodococcus sp. 105337]NME81491.1 vitamin K epoxide reductase family protein [Rhodococcus sp. 105337]
MPSTPPSTDTAAPAETAAEPGRLSRLLPWLLFVAGLVGSLAAFVLTIEKLASAADSNYIPSCNLNPVLNCGSVMDTDQAQVFGFPNSLLGIAGFAVVAATGAGLLAGACFARWYWLGLQLGVTAAAIFVHWLIIQSLYVIGALCPYCMIVWAVTIPIFWYVTLHNLRAGTFGRPIRTSVLTTAGNHLVPVTMWFLIVAALVLHRFSAYWATLV